MNFLGALVLTGVLGFVIYQIVGIVKDSKKRNALKSKQASQEVSVEVHNKDSE